MKRKITPLVLAATLMVPGPASAALKIGTLSLKPYYEAKATYDDNIYLVSPNRDGHAVAGGGVRGSWILSNGAGLKFDAPLGDEHKVTGGYDFRSDTYQKQARANDATHHAVDTAYEFKGAKTRARFWENFVNTQDPAFDPNTAAVGGSLTQRERRWQNTAGAELEYFLADKFFFGVDGQVTANKYLSPSLGGDLNHSATAFGFKTGYKVQPKTRVYLAGHRHLTHYSAGRAANHKDWTADLGVDGQIAPKVKGQVQAGFAYRRYDRDEDNLTFDPQNPLLVPSGGPKLNFTRITREWRTSLALNYKPTPRWDLNLRANRDFNETPTNASGGQYYVSSGATLDGAYEWESWTVGAGAGWQVDRYAEAVTTAGVERNRRDDLYMAGARAEYRILEWLTAGAAYGHTRRHSVFSEQFNYKDNRTSASLKVLF